ncbi:hypothetical protein RFI_18953 [Reticulomyxa filosa]|uniref:Uncharacterized protein n=1 Tax=Reticulomyxa filosa TaxID=46433 RepID=X6MWX4_RETFI|nr:hypothetical protein RFI_18953 [Reticulomyxa filosa]|eukprot:ETO18324.1 hypothetical protein RFI_18953 [Reticulomyxa filosa]
MILLEEMEEGVKDDSMDVAKDAVELICKEHENETRGLIAGERCLEEYLKANENQCPIGNHSNCEFLKTRLARQKVNDLRVICPRQYQAKKDDDDDQSDHNSNTVEDNVGRNKKR